MPGRRDRSRRLDAFRRSRRYRPRGLLARKCLFAAERTSIPAFAFITLGAKSLHPPYPKLAVIGKPVRERDRDHLKFVAS